MGFLADEFEFEYDIFFIIMSTQRRPAAKLSLGSDAGRVLPLFYKRLTIPFRTRGFSSPTVSPKGVRSASAETLFSS
jgi:hypothetical protein